MRPIAPATKHPLKRLLGLAGRAWYFITKHAPDDNLILEKTEDILEIFERANNLPGDGDLQFINRDIEGCFPNMPKKAIQFGLRFITENLKKTGKKGVFVPKRSSKQPCMWNTKRKDMMFMSFHDLHDIMQFALENTFITLNGKVLRQKTGIPMGDPLSPAMTIGGCAWMEHEWFENLAQVDKDKFVAGRYMDDILMFYKKSLQWDSDKFISDFDRSECYMEPLKLESGGGNTFLESVFAIENNQVRFNLKNVNEVGKPPAVWRYASYFSHGPFERKQAVITASLRKVAKMASDNNMMVPSAFQKIQEFLNVGYPPKLLRKLCAYMGSTTGNGAWIGIRNGIPLN